MFVHVSVGVGVGVGATSVCEKKSPGSFSRKDAREKDDFLVIDITCRQTAYSHIHTQSSGRSA